MALPELPTNWLWPLLAKMLGFWRMLNNGTLLTDVNGDPPNVPDLNAVAPLQAAYNATESRFDLSIDPEALTTEVPAGRSIYVDSIAGTPTGTPGDEGDPYDTLVGAIAAATAWLPAADNIIAIILRPGVYPTEPLTLPSWCKLASTGGRDVTIITATETDVPVITTSPNSAIEGVTIQGASAPGGMGLMHLDGELDVFTIQIRDCETGMYLGKSGDDTLVSLQHVEMTRLTDEETMQTGLVIEGAQVGMVDLTIRGSITSFIDVGVACDGAGSILSGSSLDASFVGYGLYTDNEAFAAVGSSSIVAANVGVYIGEGGADVTLGTVVFEQSITWDIQSLALAARLRTDATLTAGKVDISSGTSWTGTHVVSASDEQSFNIAGELHVGRHDKPASSSLGAGDAHTEGMVAYRYDGVSAWSDVTQQLASGTGSEIAAFSGTAAGNILYIGSDSQFPGLRLITTLAMSGGAVAVEIYTGSWTALPWMSSLAVDPYTTSGQTIFASAGDRNLRFGPTTGWVTTAVNGTTKYWWRVRITSPIVTIPRLEQARLHTDHMGISETGFTEYFGKARRWRQLELPTNSFEGVGAFAPGDQDLWFGTLGAVGLTNNAFSGTLDEAVGVGVPIPYEIDTSHRLRLRIKQQATSAVVGTVIWRVFTAVAVAGSVLTTTSPGPLGDGTPVVVTTNTPGVTGQEFISEALIDISAIVTSARPTLLIMIQRQGSVDTYNTDIHVRPGGFELDWLTWADGRPYAA